MLIFSFFFFFHLFIYLFYQIYFVKKEIKSKEILIFKILKIKLKFITNF